MNIPMDGLGVQFAKAYRAEQIAAAEQSTISAEVQCSWGDRIRTACLSFGRRASVCRTSSEIANHRDNRPIHSGRPGTRPRNGHGTPRCLALNCATATASEVC